MIIVDAAGLLKNGGGRANSDQSIRKHRLGVPAISEAGYWRAALQQEK
jgi:hypothetical protein